jgi:hypothetical protein
VRDEGKTEDENERDEGEREDGERWVMVGLNEDGGVVVERREGEGEWGAE